MANTTISKVPKLRFPGFSDEWEGKKLSELTKTISSGKSKTQNIGGEYKIYGSTGIIGRSNRYDYKGSAILVARVGAYAGTAYKVTGEYNVSDNTLIISLLDNFDLNFAFNFIKKFNLNRLVFGSGQPLVTGGMLKKVNVYTPNHEEQKKIAGFLSTVDDRVYALQKKVELLQKYKKGIMQKIFSQEIRFKDENGKDYPAWQEKKLGELGKFRSGQGFSDKEQGGKIGVPFYKVSDMNNEGNETKMTRANHYVTDEQIERLNYVVIKDKAIIFAKVGAAIFLERKRQAQNFILDNNMMAFIPIVHIDFMKYIFERTRLAKFAQVGALPSYNGSDLAIIKVSIPTSEAEQQKISAFLTSLDDKIKLEESKLEQAKQFKKALLQQMIV
ncbi:MAG: hypothetical protein RLZZ107_1386 [Bacteroidota bacterium]|jgi:type I restriction enzyme S subunit